MLHYAIKELLKRSKLYLLSVMVIGLVTLMVITLNSLGDAYKEASRLPFNDIQGTIIMQRNGNVPEDISGVLLSCSLAPIRQEVISRISKIDDVRDISTALSLWVFDADHFKRVLGVNWSDNFGKKLASKLIEGTIPKTNQEVLVEKTYAQKNALEIGRKIDIAGQQFTIVGFIGTAGNEMVASDIYLNLREAQEMAYQSKNLQEVEAFDKTDVNIVFIDAAYPNMVAATQQIKQIATSDESNAGKTPLGQTIGNYNIYTPESFEDQISAVFHISDKLIWIISLVISVGAALIAARNTLHNILERRREFGIMKSVGFRSRDISREVGIETFIQVLVGFAIGLILSATAIVALAHTSVSIAIPWELSPYPHFLLANPNEANVVQTHLLPIKLELLYVLSSFLIILVIGLIASFLGTWQINRLKPMEVMRYE
ncbi:MAG: ABC transporter permease [Dehalococcoidia bacterium]